MYTYERKGEKEERDWYAGLREVCVCVYTLPAQFVV